MDAMQKSMDEMKAQNVKIDENYMPDDVEKIDMSQETSDNVSVQTDNTTSETSIGEKIFIVVMCVIGLFVVVCVVMMFM